MAGTSGRRTDEVWRGVLAAPVPALVVGAGWLVRAANPRALALLEAESAALLGKPLLVLLSSPELPPRLRRAQPLAEIEAAVITARGGRLRALVSAAAVGKDAFAVTLVDVTARAAREKAVAASEGLFRALVEEADDVAFSMDPEGRFTYVAPSVLSLRGFTAEQAAQQTLAEVVAPDSLAVAFHYLEMVRAGDPMGRSRPLALELHRADGTTVWIELVGNPIWRDGRLVAIHGAARDMSARKQLELKLQSAKEGAEAASRAKSDFMAVVSHEIRTPMNAVLGLAALLLDGGLDPGQRAIVQTLTTAAEGLLRVVDDILDFSKLEAGRLEFDSVAFSPRQVVDQVAAMMAPRAHAKGLQFVVTAAGDVPDWLAGDPLRLRQVLLNLVSNAVKFTASGRVALRVEAVSPVPGTFRRLRFEVEDNGEGIPVDSHHRLFGHFSQADASISRRHGGTGLGLAICKRIVTLLGGRVGFDSRAGEGSLFWVELAFPLAAPPEAVEAEPAEAAPGPPLPPLSILVAEDNPTNLFVITAMLAKGGHRVTAAANGSEAVDLAAAGGFDAVLMDLQMPSMDGLEATRAIRQLPPPFSRVPIIALTANAFRSDRERCRAAGMDDYLSKPVAVAQLERTLAAHVRWPAGRAIPAPPAPTPPVLAMPEVDASIGMALVAQIGAKAVAELHRHYVDGAVAALATLKTGAASPEDAFRLVHDLKSSSRLLGLVDAAAAAAAVEAALYHGGRAERPLLLNMYSKIENAINLLGLDALAAPGQGRTAPSPTKE